MIQRNGSLKRCKMYHRRAHYKGEQGVCVSPNETHSGRRVFFRSHKFHLFSLALSHSPPLMRLQAHEEERRRERGRERERIEAIFKRGRANKECKRVSSGGEREGERRKEKKQEMSADVCLSSSHSDES